MLTQTNKFGNRKRYKQQDQQDIDLATSPVPNLLFFTIKHANDSTS